jgi:UDPglucose 6-dehydrogenase
MLEAVDAVNEAQKRVLIDKVRRHFQGKLKGQTIAVWGLAFKPRTDDIREAPALVFIDSLLGEGAKLRVHDPEALANVEAAYGQRLTYCEKQMDALDGAAALAIMTEWKNYHRPNFEEMKRRLASPVIFDGRNIYEPARMRELGFTYHSIGRPAV